MELTDLDIGARLKAARQHRKLSLRALGEQTGFSASFLSQVELGQTSPSLASLNRIAQTLGISLGALLADPADSAAPIVRRSEPRLKSAWSRATLRSLLPRGAGDHFTAVLVSLEPGGQSGKSPAAARGHELAYCVTGDLRVSIGEDRHEVHEGDSVYYGTEELVQWKNVGKKTAELILVSLRLP